MKRNTKLLLIAGMILGTISTTSCDINSIIDSILGNTPDDPTPGENEGGNENENENEGGNDNTGGNESSGGDDSTGDDNTSGDDENQPGNENQGPTVDSSSTINIKKASGYQESAFVEFEKIENLTLSNYKVSYKKNTDISYTTLDSNLIRENNDTVRCDILGLSKGVYTVKIETINSTTKYSSTIDNINVINFDRSGFAHYKTSNAIGAYNNDGTLKSNAIVVYVNEANKNTVTAKIGSTTYTGIVKILQAQSKSNVPLNIRIIGTVGAATWNQISYSKGYHYAEDIKGLNGKALSKESMNESSIISSGYNTLDTSKYSKLNNLTNNIKYEGDDNCFDSYYNMCDISSAKNVTIEGVGTDARIFQWGFTWKNSSFIEIRNLTFEDYPEDACSFEGSDESTTISGFSTGNIWFHNNNVLQGYNYWDVSYEQDKHEGDGGVDLKRNRDITISYNYFQECHKTGLVGGGETQKTANVTFHHNFYDRCGSRLPLGRQATMHMYNNYYYRSTGTNMSIRAGGYAFIENSVFENCNNPVETQTKDNKRGVVKSYNNSFINCSGTNNATIVSSRTQTVDNDNIYNKTFDTDSSFFYYDKTNKCSDVEIMTPLNEVKEYVKQYSGTLKEDFVQSDNVEEEPNLPEEDEPTIPDNGDDENKKEETISNQTIIFNAFAEEKFSSNKTNNGITITYKDGKTAEIGSIENCTINGQQITKIIKFGGGGNYSQLSIQFTTTKKANITVYYAINKDNRHAALYNEEGLVEEADVNTTLDGSIKNYTFKNLPAGNYATTSAGSGLNFYAIVIEYID